MNILKKVLFVLFIFTISFSFFGCNYKPSTQYAKEEISGNVFVRVSINLEDPKNSVLVKDAIIKLLIQKLDSKLVSEQSKADVIMNIAISSVSLQTLQYDSSGYNKLYKAVVVLGVNYTRKDNGVKKSFTVDGEYDFSVDNGATITETKRFDAISNASNKALDEVLSKIAVSSFR